MYNQENIVTSLPVGRQRGKTVRTVFGEIAAGTGSNPCAACPDSKQKHFDSRFTTFTAATFKPKQDYPKNDQTIKIYSDTQNNPLCSLFNDADIGHAEDLDESANSISSDWDYEPTMATSDWFDDLLKIETPLKKLPITDIDYMTANEYTQDIYLHLRERERNYKFNWSYMTQQPDITHNMRSILIDWLVEVAVEYKLLPETLHFTISYIDRFMSVMSVHKSKLQLVGITAMFVASKYEEVYFPAIHKFIYITDDSYTKKDILIMEKLMLDVLEFDLSLPNSHLFVNQFCNMFHLDQRSSALATYLNELAVLDGENFLHFSPSILAAGSVALARQTLREEIWSDEMAEMSGYSLKDIIPCLIKLYQAFNDADNHPQQSIQLKYRSEKFYHVANLTPGSLPLYQESHM